MRKIGVLLLAVAAPAAAQNLVPVAAPELGAQCDNMDPATLVEQLERAAGALDGKGLELVYLDNLSEVNKIHIEGSAAVQLADGSVVSIASDGHNGQAYTNVGKLFLAERSLPREYKGVVGATRRYFHDHP